MWGRNLSLYLDLYLDLSLNLPLDPPSPCALKQRKYSIFKNDFSEFSKYFFNQIIFYFDSVLKGYNHMWFNTRLITLNFTN